MENIYRDKGQSTIQLQDGEDTSGIKVKSAIHGGAKSARELKLDCMIDYFRPKAHKVGGYKSNSLRVIKMHL